MRHFSQLLFLIVTGQGLQPGEWMDPTAMEGERRFSQHRSINASQLFSTPPVRQNINRFDIRS